MLGAILLDRPITIACMHPGMGSEISRTLPEAVNYAGIYRMRLSKQQQQIIKTLASELFGDDVRVTLFGSRVDDNRKGGDIDIMITTNAPIERPALLAARLSARISRQLEGQHVDVILDAPSLKRLPIHAIAEETGIRL